MHNVLGDWMGQHSKNDKTIFFKIVSKPCVMKAGGGYAKYWSIIKIMAQINLDLHHFDYTVTVFRLLFLSFAG